MTHSNQPTDRGAAATPVIADASERTGRVAPWRSVIAAAGLPARLAREVEATARGTRLWASEKSEVARELCDHFADGLRAGRSEEELLRAFGDARRAAALIRRAKKRQRGWLWRASRRAWQAGAAAVLLCLVAYGVLAARFFLIGPSIRHNYVAEINSRALATPVEQWAWPVYIQAVREFGPLPEFMLGGRGNDPRRPGDENWDRMVAFLDAHRDAMATLRRAAAMPTMGILFRDVNDPELARAMEIRNPGYRYAPELETESENPLLIGVLLPHLGQLRAHARWCASDAHAAAAAGDRDRFLADVTAMLGMSRHAMQDPFLISTQVAVATASLATETVLEEIDRPGLLNEADLRDLAHRFADVAGGRFRIDATSERLAVADILQRFYTDDGRGDGFFAGGDLDRLYDDFGVARPRRAGLRTAMGPVRSLVLPSRAEISQLADRYVAAVAHDDTVPPWRHDQRISGKAWRALCDSGVYGELFPALEALVAGVDGDPIAPALLARDTFETRRAAVLAACALELYKRQHGVYPESLSELVPALLPSVPLDPFDGQPLRYRPAGTRPVLYSIGTDRKDDGGRVPAIEGGNGAAARWRGAEAIEALRASPEGAATYPDGDWVLWPTVIDDG